MAHYDAGIDVIPAQDANTMLTEVALLPATANHELDLLFVIDDSATMLDEQQRLAAAIPAFVQALSVSTDGTSQPRPPSLHLGVVTTDLGTTGTADTTPGGTVANCMGAGKDAAMQHGSATFDGAFLRDESDGFGPRTTNYSGALTDVVAQMMNVGDQGCPIEQPLAAMERALGNPANAGFLRDSARFAIVMMSNEDDCSFLHSSFLTSDTSTLGGLGSFRCTRFGVTCDGGGQDTAQMNIPGTKTGCQGNASSEYVTGIDRYATVLRELKQSSRDVLFALIAGPPSPFTIRLDPSGTGTPYLGGSCSGDSDSPAPTAVPAARLDDLATRIPNNTRASICDDLVKPMRQLAFRIREQLGSSRCLHAPIAVPQVCEAVDIDAAGNETVIPMCAEGAAPPCMRITQNLEHCTIIQGLEVEIVRQSPAAADTWTSVRCAT